MALSRAIWGQNVQTRSVDVELAGEQMWPWVFQMIGKLPTLKEAPQPAEPAPGITDRKPDNTLALLPPNT